jgi:hypothetical protein
MRALEDSMTMRAALGAIAIGVCTLTTPLGCGGGDSPAPACTGRAAGQLCREGVAFVDCGAGTPQRFCTAGETARCAWISDGCPYGDYHEPIGSSCTCHAADPASCPNTGVVASFDHAFGTLPWTSTDPALALTVQVDASINAPGEFAVNCSGAGATSCAKATICCQETTGPGPTPITVAARRELRDTFALWIHPGNKVFAGWQLLLEIDLQSERARACRLPFTDNPRCGEPGDGRSCASSGTVTVSTATPSDAAELRGSFTVGFADGLEITGRF